MTRTSPDEPLLWLLYKDEAGADFWTTRIKPYWELIDRSHEPDDGAQCECPTCTATGFFESRRNGFSLYARSVWINDSGEAVCDGCAL